MVTFHIEQDNIEYNFLSTFIEIHIQTSKTKRVPFFKDFPNLLKNFWTPGTSTDILEALQRIQIGNLLVAINKNRD